jgi:hypothetical protein
LAAVRRSSSRINYFTSSIAMAPSSSFWGGRTSWWSRWWQSLSQNTLGTLWQSNVENEKFRSEGGGKSLRLCFRNYTPIPLILCWMSSDGKPHHFYTLFPICDGTNTNMVTSKDRLETTCVGHAFVLAANVPKHDIERRVLDPSCIIGGYRPSTSSGDNDVHIVSIFQSTRGKREAVSCCHSWKLLGHKEEYSNDDFDLTVTQGLLDPTPIDTSSKVYQHVIIGGWPCRVEPNWHGDNMRLKKTLERDLKYATRHLPSHAREYLQTNTPIYINHSLKYGSKACPVNGKGLCFHPGKSWLCDNGMSSEKCECIELYNACDYMEDSSQWGPGGVFLHELSHAFHWKMTKGGYQNKDILHCYNLAMKDGLYDCVSVHTRDGMTKQERAYACTDQMEYFAELSTAFLGGLNEKEEYNKWFPFCKSQIKEHDPRAYKLLQRIWKVDCTTCSQ